MITKWLFPHRFRLIGWLVFIPSAILGLANMYDDFSPKWFVADILGSSMTVTSGHSVSHLTNIQNLTDEIAAIGIIVGLLLVAFSKEKVEDEMISRLRLEALQWSVYANYIILMIAIVTVYDMAFFSVMIYNMFTVLLVFIARFRWLIHRNSNLLML
ncbi:hypothetical protein [Spirosoma sp. KNUC1025]|uniref:hypothetical protein n=1 Tax=Spirosoma sp. KNUC1025 TaxID=2894082 RepID=UPI0038631CD7|nr:hypothetical protein LN737_08005 [Spirosoma sp. KNUC1025]